MTRTLIFCLFFIASSVWANVEKINSVRQFTFNHSLWDHSPSAKTNTGYWVGEFAAKNKTKYAWNGQFGFMDNTALPPSAQLGSANSKDVWIPESRKFSQLKLDNIVFMPPNFVWLEAPQERSTIAQRVISYVAESYPNIPYYIYEHWPEAKADRLTKAEWDDYKKQTNGGFHQWFVDYQNQISKANPQLDIRMIPVGPIISDILNQSSLQASNFEWAQLYEDNAPHGKVDLYFLAGLVSYQAFFGQKVTEKYKPPRSISPLISKDFVALNDFVWQRLQHYNNNGVKIWP